jgi:uncharacterized protein
MRARLERLETLLAAPGGAAAAAAEEAARDPLGVRELVARGGPLASLASDPRQPLTSEQLSPAPPTPPTIIRITPAAGATDLPASEALAALARHAVEAAAPTPGLDVEIAGAPAIAAHASRSIRRDMQRAIISSAILIQLVFLIAYRRPLTLLVVSLPAALGVVWAFGAMGVVSPALTALTAAIGGALAGLGVDYAIHLASAAREEATTPHAARRIGPAIVCAAVTSVLGFLALSFSGLAMLEGLALIGALGLAGATIATLWVGPALLRISRGAEARDRAARAVVDAVAARSRLWLALGAACAAIALIGAGIRTAAGDPWLEAASDIVHPEPNPPLAAQQRLAAAGLSPATIPVLVEAPPHALFDRCREVEAALTSVETGEVAITGLLGPHTLVPPAHIADARAARLARIDPAEVAADFTAAIADSPFAPDAFADYTRFLERLLAAPPPTLDSIGEAAARAGLLPDTGPLDAALILVRLDRSPPTTTAREQFVAGLRAALDHATGATLAGPLVMGADAFGLLSRDLPMLAAIGAGLALLWLLIFFRRPADVALAAIPALFSAAALVGVMSLLGWRFNLINMAAMPLLAGIGVDDGVFLVAASRRVRGVRAARGGQTLLPRRELLGRLGASAHAITVTTMTTSLAFGSLAFTSVPGMRSLGLLIATGAIGALLGAFLVLVPMLALRAPRDTIEETAA